jgi:hypothetical protein
LADEKPAEHGSSGREEACFASKAREAAAFGFFSGAPEPDLKAIFDNLSMRPYWWCIVKLISAWAMILVCGCQEPDTPGTGDRASSVQEPPALTTTADGVGPTGTETSGSEAKKPVDEEGSPSDYFPTAAGTRWTYDITVASLLERHAPLIHALITWPSPEGNVPWEIRGRLTAPREPTPDRSYRLAMSVIGPADRQGPLEYPEGYELRLERDDLGTFNEMMIPRRSAKKLFWAINREQRYRVVLVVMHSFQSPGAPDAGVESADGKKPGYSERTIFFGARPGLGVDREDDMLVYIGAEKFRDTQLLHFRRLVAERKNPKLGKPKDTSHDDRLNGAFMEDSWFAKGVGLVKLVQTVDNEVTMQWTLVQ